MYFNNVYIVHYLQFIKNSVTSKTKIILRNFVYSQFAVGVPVVWDYPRANITCWSSLAASLQSLNVATLYNTISVEMT